MKSCRSQFTNQFDVDERRKLCISIKNHGMGTVWTSYRVLARADPEPDFSPSRYSGEPWRISKPVKLTAYALTVIGV